MYERGAIQDQRESTCLPLPLAEKFWLVASKLFSLGVSILKPSPGLGMLDRVLVIVPIKNTLALLKMQ